MFSLGLIIPHRSGTARPSTLPAVPWVMVLQSGWWEMGTTPRHVEHQGPFPPSFPTSCASARSPHACLIAAAPRARGRPCAESGVFLCAALLWSLSGELRLPRSLSSGSGSHCFKLLTISLDLHWMSTGLSSFLRWYPQNWMHYLIDDLFGILKSKHIKEFMGDVLRVSWKIPAGDNCRNSLIYLVFTIDKR